MQAERTDVSSYLCFHFSSYQSLHYFYRGDIILVSQLRKLKAEAKGFARISQDGNEFGHRP